MTTTNSETNALIHAAAAIAGAPAASLAGAIDAPDLQQALTVLVKAYVHKRENGEDFFPVTDHITATEASVCASGILAAADLQMFELSLWNSWGRID